MPVICCEDFKAEFEGCYIEFEAVFGKICAIHVAIVKSSKPSSRGVI